MRRLRLSFSLLALAVLAGCGGPAVDMAIIAVFDNDNQRLKTMPSDEEMAFTPTRLAVVQSKSNYETYLQEELAGALRGIVSRLPGTEVVNAEAEADWVLRPEITNASTSTRKTGDETNPKWQLNGNVQGKIRIVERKTATPTDIQLNARKSKTFSSQEQSESSSSKSNVLKDAVRDAAKRQKSALKQKFPMHMYITETKGSRKYVKLNRGRIHKVQSRQRLSLLDSTTGQTVEGTVKVFQIDEETCWAETDDSARIGALVGLKCLPVGR